MSVHDALIKKILFYCVVRSCLCLVNVRISDGCL